jgi:hypothetical protein
MMSAPRHSLLPLICDLAHLMNSQDEDDVEATLSDAEVIVVKRATLEAWLKQPFLARTLPGCLLRLSLGQKRDFDGNMAATYMVAEVS